MNKNFEEKVRKNKSPIRIAREEVFKIVFGIEAIEGASTELKDAFDVYLKNNEEFVSTLSDKQFDFLNSSISGIIENYDYIKNIIKKNIQNWAYERIGIVEKSLLIVATYEIMIKNSPIEVIANETVELAKEYGDEKSYEFVNGILANIENFKNKGTI